MKKLTAFSILFITFVLLATYLLPFYNTAKDISKDVFRLHILANSDEAFDQDLKLEVRDNILRYSKEIYERTDSLQDVIDKSNNHIDEFNRIAEETIKSEGYDYPVDVYVDNEYFNTRDYDSFTLPSGFYNALKIVIGSGEGHNWWCIMFPAVCLPEVSDDEIENVLDDDELQLIKSNRKYEVRFKIVEVYNKIKDEIR